MKTSYKKVLVLLIYSLVLLLTPILASRAIQFSDIKTSDSFLEDVEDIVGLGIMEGYSDGTFRPDEYVSRAELATILNQYNDYLKTQYSPKNTTSLSRPKSSSTGSELDFHSAFKCSPEKKEYCRNGECTEKVATYSLTFNMKDDMVTKCSSWECTNRKMDYERNGKEYIVNKKSGKDDWNIVINSSSKTYTEEVETIRGVYITTGTCENVT